ncbi:MAG: hypothetical protein ABIN74_03625 [Ferruginibacter sp.]
MKDFSLILVFFFLLPLFTWAQDASDILIFSFEGEVMISRNKMMIPCTRAERIVAKDIIHVKKGVISLIDRNLKRVTLEKKGNYSYRQIVKYFSLANASLENLFLLQVLDKMAHKPNSVSYAGGVIRGTTGANHPMDSAIILSDSIRFVFANREKIELTFTLVDEDRNVLFSKETTDSLVVLKKQDAGWWKPGSYSWEATTPDKMGSAERRFFIPKPDEQARYLYDYYRLKIAFPAFSLNTRNQLIDEILTLNKWIMY